MKRLGKLLLILSVICAFTRTSCYAEKMLQIKGSDTLINLVQKLSEVYMEKNSGKYISVTGGGSGTGVAAIINGKCDIANSSRDMTAKEIDRAISAGVTPKRVVIAIDGLSVIVNANNPVTKLTMAQLEGIYNGNINNWRDVGGKDMAINLYGRQPNSGTYQLFREVVVKGDYSSKMKEMNGNAQLVEAVEQDKSGIAYVGVGYIKNLSGISVVNIAAFEGGEYTNPLNEVDVKSGRYPIARPLNQYVNGSPTGAIKDFLAFELSPEGQKIVEEEGFFAIPPEYAQLNKKSLGI